MVLKLWGDELNARPTDEKRSFRGKLTSATHTQTVDYIKPLFKTLKRKVTTDILHEVRFAGHCSPFPILNIPVFVHAGHLIALKIPLRVSISAERYPYYNENSRKLQKRKG